MDNIQNSGLQDIREMLHKIKHEKTIITKKEELTEKRYWH